MTENKPEYVTDAEEMIGKGYEAAIIQPPQKLRALSDKGLVEYNAWGWVKTSAKFIAHIKNLKGAKLSIWMCIALSIDENGSCKRTIKEICALTGYSHTEVIESLKEMDAMGYLSVDRNQKSHMYAPAFAARGGNNPSEGLVKKLESTVVDQYESSPSIQNSIPTIKELKELSVKPDLLDGLLAFELNPKSLRKALSDYFPFNTKWDTKYAREWMEWAVSEHVTPDQIRQAAERWKNDPKFNWQHPSLKGLYEKWPALMQGIGRSASPVKFDTDGTPETY